MSQPAASSATFESAHTSPVPDTRLHGRWLVLARLGWVVLVIALLALFVGSLPAYDALIQTPCGSVTFPCGNLTGSLDAAGLQGLRAAGISLSGHAAYIVALTVAVNMIWAVVGLVIFWRRSDDWVALLGALALLIGQVSDAFIALAYSYPAWTVPVDVANLLSAAAIALFVCVFPSGRFAPRWMRWVLAFYPLFLAFNYFPPANSPLNLASRVPVFSALAYIGFFMAVIFSQIYRYRRVSNAVQRQQIKWAVFGIILSLGLLSAVFVLSIVIGVLNPNPQGPLVFLGIVSDSSWLLASLPIPIFIGIAVSRSRLWDIDAIINKALVYGLLTGLLGALYAGLIIGLENLAGLLGGTAGQNPIVLVVSTLVIAALFQPARRRIQNVIDRRFYRKKYDAEKTLAAFSATLRNEVDLEEIRERLLVVVQETMQPAHVSLWLRPPDGRARDAAHQSEPSRAILTGPGAEYTPAQGAEPGV